MVSDTISASSLDKSTYHVPQKPLSYIPGASAQHQHGKHRRGWRRQRGRHIDQPQLQRVQALGFKVWEFRGAGSVFRV